MNITPPAALPDGVAEIIYGDGPVLVMDSDCVLCTWGARTISRIDKRGEFRICPAASPRGQAILKYFGLAPDDPESWLVVEDGRAFGSLEAMIRVGRRCGGWGHLLRLLAILPRPVQDWLYVRVARNRYRIFGRTDMCAIPDPELKRRLIE